jgi:hypothetical protein
MTPDPPWDIRREGRAWGAEAMTRYALTPEKLEMNRGKLLWDDEDVRPSSDGSGPHRDRQRNRLDRQADGGSYLVRIRWPRVARR